MTVSTHIVPQASLHAMAAAVSVGLGMHGPSLGVGGGADALADGLLTLAALAATPGVDGWWLVATQFSAEPTLDANGDATTVEGLPPAATTVGAVALFVTTAESVLAERPLAWLDLSVRVTPDGRLADRLRPSLVTLNHGCSEKEAA